MKLETKIYYRWEGDSLAYCPTMLCPSISEAKKLMANEDKFLFETTYVYSANNIYNGKKYVWKQDYYIKDNDKFIKKSSHTHSRVVS